MSKKSVQKIQSTNKETKLELHELPETGEFEVEYPAVNSRPAKRVRFPKENFKRFRLKPKQFRESQIAVENWDKQERRGRAVYPTSLEVNIGYDSLFRVMRDQLANQAVYYRSKEGGMLSFEETVEKVYGADVKDEEYLQKIFEEVTAKPVDSITFSDLWKLSFDSPATAENVWELIKRGARGEFLSGHTAAEAMEPLEKIKTAWMRAKYIGARESFISEWKPQNSIELNVIDTIVQSWFMFQHWMKVMSLRSIGEVKREPDEFKMWKNEQMVTNPRRYKAEKFDWETPSLTESEAIEQAAQMVDRFHRIYCRSIRLLQSLRKNTPPQVTINNPRQVNMGEQVNVATDGGKQINMKTDD